MFFNFLGEKEKLLFENLFFFLADFFVFFFVFFCFFFALFKNSTFFYDIPSSQNWFRRDVVNTMFLRTVQRKFEGKIFFRCRDITVDIFEIFFGDFSGKKYQKNVSILGTIILTTVTHTHTRTPTVMKMPPPLHKQFSNFAPQIHRKYLIKKNQTCGWLSKYLINVLGKISKIHHKMYGTQAEIRCHKNRYLVAGQIHI